MNNNNNNNNYNNNNNNDNNNNNYNNDTNNNNNNQYKKQGYFHVHKCYAQDVTKMIIITTTKNLSIITINRETL